eukprot:749359-Hanusia_phi.AAC.1
MASAAARVAGVSKESTIEEFVLNMRTMYVDKGMDDPALRATIGVALKELVLQSRDSSSVSLHKVIPLVMVGKEDEDEASRSQFQTIWEESVGSLQTALRMFGHEIIEFVELCFASSSWLLRKMTAKASVFLVSSSSHTQVADISRAQSARKLLPILVQNIQAARIWDGKENVLQAIAASVVAIDLFVEKQEGNGAELQLEGWSLEGEGAGDLSRMRVACVLVSECTRKKRTYRLEALRACTMMFSALKSDLGISQDVLAAVKDVIVNPQEKKEEDQRPTVSGGRSEEEEQHYDAMMEAKSYAELRTCALETLVSAWLLDLRHARSILPDLLGALRDYSHSVMVDEKQAAVGMMRRIAERLAEEGSASTWDSLSETVYEGLSYCIEVNGPQLRDVQLGAVAACLKWLDLHGRFAADSMEEEETSRRRERQRSLLARLLLIVEELLKEQSDINFKSALNGLHASLRSALAV